MISSFGISGNTPAAAGGLVVTSANTDTTIHTIPANTTAFFTSIRCVNIGAVPLLYSIWIVRAGSGNIDRLIGHDTNPLTNLPAGVAEDQVDPNEIILMTGDSLHARCNNAASLHITYSYFARPNA